MPNFFSKYPSGGGSSGVSELNGLTGALTLVAGSGVTITEISATEIEISASGSAPTGDVNTLAYFDSAGDLASNTNAGFNDTANSMFFGVPATVGQLVSTGNGSLAQGLAAGTGVITASGSGSQARGGIINSGAITASASGSEAHGSVNVGSIIANANGSKAHGATGGGTITASGIGAYVHGIASDTATLTASGVGAEASGQASNTSSITASITGAKALGITANSGQINAGESGAIASGRAVATGQINATVLGSRASGQVTGNGQILSSGVGSRSAGQTVNGTITASGIGSIAQGLTSGSGGGGTITASANGSQAMGVPTGLNGQITASSVGAKAHGSGFSIIANGIGSEASGQGAGTITASGFGSKAMGVTNTNRSITASGTAALAAGNVVSFDILASAGSTIAYGYANEQNLEANGAGSQAFGDSNIVSGTYATAFGLGHTHNSYSSLIIGRYGNTSAEDASNWVPTDTLFMAANGTDLVTPDYAMRIQKDGTLFIKDPSLATASVNDVWTLQNTATGEGAWQSPFASAIAFSAYGATTSNVSSTPTLIIFGSEYFDTDNAYDNTTGEFTAPVDGIYRVNAGVHYGATSIGVGGVQELYLYKNGSVFVSLDRGNVQSYTGVEIQNSGSYLIQLVAGDVLTIYAANNTTTSLDGSANNYFSVNLVR